MTLLAGNCSVIEAWMMRCPASKACIGCTGGMEVHGWMIDPCGVRQLPVLRQWTADKAVLALSAGMLSSGVLRSCGPVDWHVLEAEWKLSGAGSCRMAAVTGGVGIDCCL